jgi:hypothetical protein
VTSDCDNHYEDGHVERVFRPSFDSHMMLLDYHYDRNFLVRSSIFPKLGGGFNESLQLMDDYEFLLRVSEIGLIYHIPSPLHHNRVAQITEEEKNNIEQAKNTVRQLTTQRRQSK